MDLLYFRGFMPLDDQKWWAQGEVQREFVLDTLGRFREGLEHLQPSRQVTDRLNIR